MMAATTTADPPAAPAPSRQPPRIPAELLYWAKIPGGLDGMARAYAAERLFPQPIEELHWTAADLPSGGGVVVALPPDAFRRWLVDHAETAQQSWQVLPDRLPPVISEAPADSACVAQLNLLSGDFETQARRRWRRITIMILACGSALLAVTLMMGVERRVSHLRAQAQAWQQATNVRIARAVGLPDQAANPEIRLVQEIRRLDQTGGSAKDSDVLLVLQALWQVWPRNLNGQMDSLSVAGDRLLIRGSVPSMVEANRLATAVAEVRAGRERWRADPLQVNSDSRATTIVLTLVRQGKGP